LKCNGKFSQANGGYAGKRFWEIVLRLSPEGAFRYAERLSHQKGLSKRRAKERDLMGRFKAALRGCFIGTGFSPYYALRKKNPLHLKRILREQTGYSVPGRPIRLSVDSENHQVG